MELKGYQMIVLDEGHKAYSIGAQQTLFGFNPAFVLELSATPVPESNKLVEIGVREVLQEGMIKLDLHLHTKASDDWRDTLRASHERRGALKRSAQRYAMNGGDYIRPICLIQVERTSERQRRAGLIHAEDAREFLIQRCNVLPHQIAVKSSERDELDVGRMLRQPYARKTRIAELDESYVYCARDRSGRVVQAAQYGLMQEGLGEVSGRVVLDQSDQPGSYVDVFVRPEHQQHAGRVYLLCFVVSDGRVRTL